MGTSTGQREMIERTMEALGLDSHEKVQERKAFLDISEEDEERIRAVAPMLSKYSNGIIDKLYSHLMKFDTLERLIPDETAALRLKGAQKSYFHRLMEGSYDLAYVEERIRIGLVHVQVDLKPQWYLGTYNLYLCLVTEALFKEMGGGGFRKPWVKAKCGGDPALVLQSLMKIVFFDMTLAIDSYASLTLQLRDERDTFQKTLARVTKSSRDLILASEALSGSSEKMSANLEETSRRISLVSDASGQASQHAQTVAAAAEEMSVTINEISRNVQEATRVTHQAVKEAGSAKSIISKLGDSSAEIGKVVKVITSIARQTNLLALNATIEAARAGEAGKGFGVVANEVKELAKQTASATEEIKKKIELIQSDTRGAVSVISKIVEVIGQIDEISTNIAGAMEEQTVTTGEIARNISEVTEDTGAVVQNISGMIIASKSAVDVADTIRAASRRLSKMTEELEAFVSELKGSGTKLEELREEK